jgi:lipoprotein-anchoring transpeptidase ErfK/SrfK
LIAEPRGTQELTVQHRFRFALRALALALLVSTTACGSAAVDTSETSPTEPGAVATTTVPGSRTTASLRLLDATVARTAPDENAVELTTLAPRTELGSVTTLLVLDEHDGWFEVVVPIRPNGTTGWVRADAGEVRTTKFRIDVDLGARRLTLFDGDAVVFGSDIAIGAPDTPTPIGYFSVTDLVATDDPDGPYGPNAVGLSGHSNELTEFAGGDGQVGIHGTNDPGSIGRPVSHGCVRLPNDVVAELVRRVPLGTPVTFTG